MVTKKADNARGRENRINDFHTELIRLLVLTRKVGLRTQHNTYLQVVFSTVEEIQYRSDPT